MTLSVDAPVRRVNQSIVILPGEPSDESAAVVLLDDVRRAGLASRASTAIAFIVGFGERRDDAYATAELARTTDWGTRLYGDETGWVLHLSREHPMTRPLVLEDVRAVRLLASHHDGDLRCAVVEDLHPHDEWAEMATRVAGGSARRAPDADAPATAAQQAAVLKRAAKRSR